MIRWFTKNHVAANLLMFGILLSGIWVATEKLGVEVEPAVVYKRLEVQIDLRGGTPEDIEKQIILPVEQALENTPGIKSVEAEARNGNAEIDIRAENNAKLSSGSRKTKSIHH